MKSSEKHSGQVLTLHQRLYHALNLGSWEKREKWHCSDIELQKLVIRSIDAFLDCISKGTLVHPLIKDSVVDILKALEAILEFKSQSVLRSASSVVAKMVNVLPSSMLQANVLVLISPLVNLLSSPQQQVATSCAAALNSIISNLNSRKDSEVLLMLKANKTISYVVQNINGLSVDNKPIEYFQEMFSLLSKMLCRWPSFRFCVWSDSKFLNVLNSINLLSENSSKVAVLKLYTSLALCHVVADKLLKSGESLIQMMVGCMDCSNSLSVRVEAYKLAQCLGVSKMGCGKMIDLCCEPLVKSVVTAINDWNSLPEQLAEIQMPFMKEACRLAFITRWAGDHHKYFWKSRVDRILLELLLDDYHKISQRLELSLGDLVIIVRKSLNSSFKLSLRPYAWDILGGLVLNYTENLNHEIHGNDIELNSLIVCACVAFIDSMKTSFHISENTLTNTSQGEPAARAVLMMVYSPCKYIASTARSILFTILTPNYNCLEYLLKTLKDRMFGNMFGMPGEFQVVMNLMSLSCLSSFPEHRELIIKCGGTEILVAFISWWLKNPVHIKRESIVPHLHDSFSEKLCCFPFKEDWEGQDLFLLLSLWILAELLFHSATKNILPSVSQAEFGGYQFVQELEKVCSDCIYSPGSRWYASFILCHFGIYGFPCKLGTRIGKALGEYEHTDLKFDLVSQEGVFVHEVILMVRCPSLLPPRESVAEWTTFDGSNVEHNWCRKQISSVRLSAHVDRQLLLKLLEYVYMGYLETSDDLVKRLKIFAKHCKLEDLLDMLCGIFPRWGAAIPRFDLSPALEHGHNYSNLCLEANSSMVHWKCKCCSASVPHLHVHKIVMASNCDYLRALFQSGMQESYLKVIKVPVSWVSLNKIVIWFYSGQLSVPNFDCSWENLDPEEKFNVVESYLEVCWLAEFWLVDDLYEECYKVVISCFSSSTYLPPKTIQVAADFSLWKLVQEAANRMAPSYHHLRNSGALDNLDSNLVEMIRVASVRLSQQSSHHFSSAGVF